MSDNPKFNILGNPNIVRRDITRKITGTAVYATDINPAHIGVSPTAMLYAGVVTCPYPRAKILSIDTSAAEAAGFVTLRGDELPPYSYWGGGRTRAPLPNLATPTMYPMQP